MNNKQLTLYHLFESLKKIDKRCFSYDIKYILEQFNVIYNILKNNGFNDEALLWKNSIIESELLNDIKYDFIALDGTYSADMYDSLINISKALLIGFIDKHGIKTNSSLFDLAFVEECNSVIKDISKQLNGCYEMGYYDACLILVRRLLETMIFGCYLKKNIEESIIDENKNIPSLKELIDEFLKNNNFFIQNIARKKLKNLQKIREISNQSAHNMRFNAKKQDIELYAEDIRICVQELASFLTQKVDPNVN